MDTLDSYRSLAVTPNHDRDRLSAVIAHGGTAFAWFLAPLIVYLIKRKQSPWAEYQAMQALLWSVGGTLVSLATCGLAIPVFLAFHIYAAYKIASGEDYEYPLVGDAARRVVYARD